MLTTDDKNKLKQMLYSFYQKADLGVYPIEVKSVEELYKIYDERFRVQIDKLLDASDMNLECKINISNRIITFYEAETLVFSTPFTIKQVLKDFNRQQFKFDKNFIIVK